MLGRDRVRQGRIVFWSRCLRVSFAHRMGSWLWPLSVPYWIRAAGSPGPLALRGCLCHYGFTTAALYTSGITAMPGGSRGASVLQQVFKRSFDVISVQRCSGDIKQMPLKKTPLVLRLG